MLEGTLEPVGDNAPLAIAAPLTVKVGLVSDTSTEILEGLDVGEIVVADAGSSLHDGDQIKTMFAEELDRTRVR